MNRKTMQRLSKLLTIATLGFFYAIVYALWTANFELLLKLAAAWIVMIAAFVLTVAYCIGKEDKRR
jgi:predicted Na+-dependent transporter|tara:strand:+ start:764 stop:961 length:198 start_codon:yes stop_codon:yes gene_type:complete